MKKNSIFSLDQVNSQFVHSVGLKFLFYFLFIIVFLSIVLWREKGRYWQIFRNTFIFKMSVIKKKKTLPRMHNCTCMTLWHYLFFSSPLSLSLSTKHVTLSLLYVSPLAISLLSLCIKQMHIAQCKVSFSYITLNLSISLTHLTLSPIVSLHPITPLLYGWTWLFVIFDI